MHPKLNLIIWLTGQSGAGKTTIARLLKEKMGGIILDGDEMRESISNDLGFSNKDRMKHNIRIAKLAAILAKDVAVIVALIAPFENLRQTVTEIAHPVWVYVEKNIEISKEKPFEIPQRYHLKVNSDKQTTNEQVEMILDYLKKKL